jgi:hypothetical protein
MKIIEFIQEERKVQQIIVSAADKYGVAMIAYFKNSLRGENVQRLAVRDSSKVVVYFDRFAENYVLQILDFRIANVEEQYRSFYEKYDLLIKDPISHLKEKDPL